MTQVEILSGSVRLVADVEGTIRGPTVLLLHAGGERRSVWLPITPRLIDAGWRTIAPDLRGHGESGRSPRYVLDDLIDDAGCVIQELTDRPLVVVGGSIGAAIGLLLAGERGVPLDGLVLIDVPTFPRADRVQLVRTQIAAAQAARSNALVHLDPEFMTGTFVDDVLADVDRWRRAARRVRIPVLLVRAERSKGIGPEELSEFLADVPQAEVASIDAGHLVAHDNPEQLARLLTEFILRLRGTGSQACA